MDGLIQIAGTFSRCVSRKRDPLSTEGARLQGGRFNPKGCPALYLAATPALAVAESLQLASLYGVTSFNPRLLVSIDVVLSSVLDLADPRVHERLGVSPEDLDADWRTGPEPTLCQRIGEDAAAQQVEGILYPSHIDPAQRNLCVFRENLLATSHLVVQGYDDVLTDLAGPLAP